MEVPATETRLKTLFAKSAWEIYESPVGRFVDLTLADGYDAVELYLLDRPEKPAEIMRLLEAARLPLIAQIVTGGATAEELVARHGIAICHETHRGRALFALPASLQFLRAVPSLRLTADLSHWFCVHESDLGDQDESLNEALARVDHIHGRVGFQQGPQISDPRNPAHAKPLARSVELWTRILQNAKKRGQTEFTLTPEFGPVP